ncbi:hypothetical protein FRX31_014327 [Thalictrum thalictroides]|uniref:Uncharacterized protein n=1 Tax=Thalictrum thalictroides TaxID=46969 RepID=A0A7J6WHI1_THATH|nr:hypothetical protein FRX31_014327 [Thalictrum thalictroides]
MKAKEIINQENSGEKERIVESDDEDCSSNNEFFSDSEPEVEPGVLLEVQAKAKYGLTKAKQEKIFNKPTTRASSARKCLQINDKQLDMGQQKVSYIKTTW